MNGRVRVGVCMTGGVSLRRWEEQGLLDREIAPYRRMADKGVAVTLVTYGDDDDLGLAAAVAPLEVVPFRAGRGGRSSPFLAPLWAPVRHRRRFRGFDIVKTNQMLGSWAGVEAKLLHGTKLIVRCGFDHYRFAVRGGRPWPRRAAWFAASALAYRAADRVVVTSEEDRRFVARTFRVPASRLTLIPNAVDTTLFRPLAGERIPDRALFVGRLEPQKNVLALLDAIDGTGLGLDIVGTGSLRTDVERRITAGRLSVRLLPRVPNRQLPELMSRYAVLALPSHYEGNPKALLEAMSCGLAVVAADAEGIREIVRHGVNGWLCGTDAASIRVGLRALFADPALRARLGERAREHVIVHHEIDEVVRQEIALYHDLLAKAPR